MKQVIRNQTLLCHHPSCQRWRSLKCFSKNKTTKTGYDYICKDCKKEDYRQKKLFPKEIELTSEEVFMRLSKSARMRIVGARLNKGINNG